MRCNTSLSCLLVVILLDTIASDPTNSAGAHDYNICHLIRDEILVKIVEEKVHTSFTTSYGLIKTSYSLWSSKQHHRIAEQLKYTQHNNEHTSSPQ